MKKLFLLGCIAALFIACGEEELPGAAPVESEFTIGQEHEGGLIAIIDATGQHGLIIANKDQSTSKNWEDAVTLCNDLSLNGFDDWYLPSQDELEKIYNNRKEIGGINTTAPYWSSSERSEETAYCRSFTEGHQYYDYYVYHKSNPYRVRAVRKF